MKAIAEINCCACGGMRGGNSTRAAGATNGVQSSCVLLRLAIVQSVMSGRPSHIQACRILECAAVGKPPVGGRAAE